MTRFLSLLKKELLQLVKNPKTRATVFVPPLLQLFLLGYAATMDLKKVPFAVLDRANTSESREAVARFAASDVFDFRGTLADEASLKRCMDEKRIKLALSFASDGSTQIIADGRNTTSANTAIGYAQEILGGRVSARSSRLQIRGWFNPNYNARWFMVPCLLAILVLLALTLLVALSLAREREEGTLDQLRLTPFTPVQILAAKGLSGVIVGLCQLALCLVVVKFHFRIPYVSSWGLLLALFVCFLAAAVGMGLLVSVYSRNLQQAMILTFLFAIPLAMLSGMATPVACMPDFLQKVVLLNPVRWAIDALQRLFLEGATFADVWPSYAILAAIGSFAFILAAVRFCRK